MLNHFIKNRRKYKTMPLPIEQQFVRSDMLQSKQESGLTWGGNMDFLYLGIDEEQDPCANLLGVSDDEVAAAKVTWAAAKAKTKAVKVTAEYAPVENAETLSTVVFNTGQDDPDLGGGGADVVTYIAVSALASREPAPARAASLENLADFNAVDNYQPSSLEQALNEALPFSSGFNIEQMDMYCGELPELLETQDVKSQLAPDSCDNGINWAWQKLANMEAQFEDKREGGEDSECWQFDPHVESAVAEDENAAELGPYETELPKEYKEPMAVKGATDGMADMLLVLSDFSEESVVQEGLEAGNTEQSIANFGRSLSQQKRCQNFRFTVVESSTDMATEVTAAEDGVAVAHIDDVDNELLSDAEMTATYADTEHSAQKAYQNLEQYFIDLTQSFDKSYERQAFYNLMVNLGPDIRQALVDPDVTEIMVNGDAQIFIEMTKTGMRHIGALSSESAQAVIRILASLDSKELNMDQPILSGEIPRLNARFEGLLPPLVIAPVFSIRRHHFQNLSLDQLFKTGMLTAEQHQVLLEALKEHLSIVVCGATGSGKTTLLNGLICEIAKNFPQERIITIEDTPELRISSYNKLNLYTSDHVDMSSLVRSSLRLRPDRLIVGEVRGAEALDLLDAFSTGHRGGLTSIHAGSIDQALNRLTLLVSRHPKAPRLIEPTVGDAIDLLVVVQRLPYRHICHMAKLNGYKNQAFSYEMINF